jgi:cell division control protein 11
MLSLAICDLVLSDEVLHRHQSLLPFALVGSEEDIMVNGQTIRGRRYPWGIVEVDNPQHSDFTRLRQALLM